MNSKLSKKFAPLALSVSLLTVPSMAFAEKVDAKYEKAAKQEKREKLNKKLEYLGEQLRKTKDFDKAIEATTKKYNGLQVVDTDDKDGSPIQALSNEPGWISLTDRIVYDDESDEYVFIGYWEWDEDEGFVGREPYDFVGVFTDSTSVMPIDVDAVVLQGWNGLGDEEAFFDTSNDRKRGKVALARRATDAGVGFWINDKYVTNGMITAVLEKVSTNKKIRAYIQYDHSWAYTNITGIGGNAGKGAGGFTLSWETGVKHLEPLYSTGEYWK